MPLEARKAARRELDGEPEGDLRSRLEELEETLRAIRSGEVDALVVETTRGDEVFTLKSADQTYRQMVEQMQNGAATLSEDGLVLYCNPFLAALLDVPKEALLGAPLSGFLDEPGGASLGALLRNAEGGVSLGELWFRSGGRFVPTQVSLDRLPLQGATVFCLIVTDLTEQKRREEDRAQLASEQAARATAEEAHRRAQEEIARRKQAERREYLARTDAEAANRLKDEFLATLSHELRTPLSAIVSWSHLLREGSLDPGTASRAVEAIHRNARAQAQIVSDLLDVSRIIKGQFHLRSEPVLLAGVIESAAETLRPAAQAKDIRLDLAMDPGAGPVSGDASRLQQVIWNLLSNAIKFAPIGGWILARLDNAGAWVELSVTDDGPGIDPTFLPCIFDRFRQADSSSTRQHAGLGLGLAIARHLVELHGGTIQARNREDGSGAAFIVRLPRQLSAEEARARR